MARDSQTGAAASQLDPTLMREFVDLRSDTVTRPTPAMRRAMSEAEVGDDVYGEDPTVNRLQERAAELFGREAALFVPSGSMGNLVCVLLHCKHGEEAICESKGHTYNFELASMSAVAGCLPRPVETSDGILTWRDIEPALRPKVYYRAPTSLIILENTHNMAGGAVLPKEGQEEICAQAHERGISVHLDGARIFNAATALKCSVAEVSRGVDSIMFCVSKALGAPVGSLIVASRELIEKARVYRKMLGGGMRQVGVLAAAGLVALEEGPAKLPDDHRRARILAEVLGRLPGVKVNHKVQTNIVVFDVSETGGEAGTFAEKLKEDGILVGALDSKLMRMVTHYDVDDEGIDRAVQSLQRVFGKA